VWVPQINLIWFPHPDNPRVQYCLRFTVSLLHTRRASHVCIYLVFENVIQRNICAVVQLFNNKGYTLWCKYIRGNRRIEPA
jgi:hypothetical protein